MAKGEGPLIAACGLDCTDCDIRKVPIDAEAAERIVGWFRSTGWLKESEGVPEIIERSMYCKGCRGDRSVHWSADCAILNCCVDERTLKFCYECDDFVCDQLDEWAQKETQYTQALERLERMRAEVAA
jgi:hypothetical protein